MQFEISDNNQSAMTEETSSILNKALMPSVENNILAQGFNMLNSKMWSLKCTQYFISIRPSELANAYTEILLVTLQDFLHDRH